jgi:hypothetical protein
MFYGYYNKLFFYSLTKKIASSTSNFPSLSESVFSLFAFKVFYKLYDKILYYQAETCSKLKEVFIVSPIQLIIKSM